MGYSVLMNTRVPQLAPADQVPTELSPMMTCSAAPNSLIPSPTVETKLGNLSGKTVRHNELGGLVNTYSTIGGAVPNGRTLTLSPQLPEGEEDTGLWQWNTGETTREITVGTERSYIYRVTYTNARGITSQLCFPIACQGDGDPIHLTPVITYNGTTTETDTINVLYAKNVTLSATPTMGGGKWKWSGNQTTQTITTAALRTPSTFTVTYTHTNGVTSTQDFHIGIHYCEPYITQGTVTRDDSTLVCAAGSDVTIGLRVPTGVTNAAVSWSTGETGRELTLTDLQTTTTLTATFTVAGRTITQSFTLFVRDAENSRLIEPGNYVVQHAATGRLLTNRGLNQTATFEPGDPEHPGQGQVWLINRRETAKYNISSQPDSLLLNTAARSSASSSYPFYLWGATGTNRYAIYSGTTASTQRFWSVNDEGTIVINQTTTLSDFPFLLIPIGPWDGIRGIEEGERNGADSQSSMPHSQYIYDLSGRRVAALSNSSVSPVLPKGVYIRNGRRIVIR